MKKLRPQSPKINTHHYKYGVSFAWAFTGTLLVASSVAQASDMQIYAVPTAGKKTIVMMLDTSGSMGNSDTGQTGTRLARLKAGMNAFLDSNDATLSNVSVGLGHYSLGDRRGKILVPAAPLGVVGSAQRSTLRTAVDGLTASGYTPTAHAYAEAAAYLMGTSTRSEAEIQKDLYKKITNTDSYRDQCDNPSYPYLRTYSNQNSNRCYQRSNFSGPYISAAYRTVTTINYYKCISWRTTDFNNGVQYCGSGSNSYRTSTSSSYWQNLGNTEPTDFWGDGNETNSSVIYTYTNEMQLGPNADSGFADSVGSSKSGTNYISPLPAAADRVSCDGQGVYILSDGEANRSSTARSTAIMSAALGSSGSGFSCPSSGGLTNLAPDGESAWHCMGEFAKKLFDRTTNPAGVSIQTAFVGFGNDFNAMAQPHVQQACKLSSRTQADRNGNDTCSPGQPTTHALASPGYGNGGFFTTQSAQGVTASVIAFINNLGAAPLAPLTTGAISVPSDALSPSGFQPYGYLRALEPDPQGGKLVWAGNLKRYKVLTSGANAGAFGAADGSTLVYNTDGSFRAGTKDLWNSIAVYNNRSYNDGGIIGLGGAYSRLPMPISGQTENLTVTPKQYEFAAAPDALRKLYTDVSATGGATLAGAGNGANLLRIPEGPLPATGVPAYVLGKFGNQTTLQDMPLLAKQKLLNYLGYSVPLDATATALPTTLALSPAPHVAMGGSIHSFPVQLTYSGTLDASGNLTSTRSQSILYGTMEGGLHIVDSETGKEQMVFVPAELLRNSVASKALVKGEADINAPQAGLDGAWVADSLYTAQRSSSPSTHSVVKARKMNVYGGLRMGGESYYGLDVLDPDTPKFLFRVGRDQSDFSRMGQSWSKPVLANIRYGNAIKRVMIVGGGYDQCYENPRFSLGASVSNTDFPDATCNNKSKAQGNAVYVVDADTGARLWWASNTGANSNNANMTHSVVSRISTIDRDGDGLVDHLYFGDLGGQVFRADLNNTAGTTTANFGKRVVRLANLATTTAGAALADGKNPRFYEAPTVTIHDQGATTFMLIGLASGNRSTPLDVTPTIGRDGMLPTTALNDRLVNNVYGVIDRDFIRRDLITGTPTLSTQNVNLQTMQINPQLLAGNVPNVFIGTSATKNGWYRSLSSNSLGVERTANGFRVAGGMKAFEEPIALTGNLIVPVYDPQGTGIAPQNPCLPRVVGETNRQRYCLPFGACLTTTGTVNTAADADTGFQTKTTGCPAGVTECNDKTLGSGIVGITPAPVEESTAGSCPDFTIAGNTAGAGRWQCIPTINPTRWYERWKK
ncbi:PilC/PilY family type IV pilus protein [Acinetobacter junii]|uniref:VWA domain-containing protein n=1 Tax=Acinetobacter junii TaxID=40215 RepID=UPI0035F6A5E5